MGERTVPVDVAVGLLVFCLEAVCVRGGWDLCVWKGVVAWVYDQDFQERGKNECVDKWEAYCLVIENEAGQMLFVALSATLVHLGRKECRQRKAGDFCFKTAVVTSTTPVSCLGCLLNACAAAVCDKWAEDSWGGQIRQTKQTALLNGVHSWLKGYYLV